MRRSIAPPRRLRSAVPLPKDIAAYNAAQSAPDRRICGRLARAIDAHYSGPKGRTGVTCKVWHRHPVWFMDGNPIVGYSTLRGCVRLLFWSGQSFDEPGLVPEGTFRAAEARFTDAGDIPAADLARWLDKAIRIQWDYKNLVKRRGRLRRLA
ncbi:MAG: DUF1801 domain-containing protein [Phycisphaerales bacterium]|nr:DUF1801 domain-containing protein [Phycisphaerales bacterium]